MIGQAFQQYRVVLKLGEGGMGEVYLADDVELRRKVALKFLPSQLSSNPDLKARFKREAQAAAALNHPNIITIYQVGEYNNQAFIAMEYVEGQSLRDMLSEGSITVEKALEIVIQCCEGLNMAHERGIVHRDLKPANIMVDRLGRVKILDFGLAKFGDVTRLTKAGTAMGTPHYMSPEQVKGDDLNQQSDIYSLGVILYELLCGELPFQGYYEAAILYSIANEKPTPITKYKPGLQKGLVQVIDKALEKRLQKRYQGVDEMRTDLQREQRLLQTAGQPTVTTFRVPAPAPRKRPWRRYAALVSAALSGVVLWLLFTNTPTWLDSAGVSRRRPDAKRGTTPSQPSNQPVQMAGKGVILQPKEPNGTKANPPPVVESFGELEVTSQPGAAQVWLNGRQVGRTPFSNSKLKPETYRLRVTLAGYRDYEETLKLQPGVRTRRTARLIPLREVVSRPPPTGRLNIVSQPTGAEVWLDERKLEHVTPYLAENLPPGSHKLVLKKEGYQDYTTTVQVVADKLTHVTPELKALVGTLKILVKPYGSIFIDGRLHKNDWEFVYQVELRAGSHVVKAVHPTFGEWEKTVSVAAGPSQDLVIDFRKKVNLVVSVTRGWAEVFVDGESVGDTPKPVELHVGKHTIEVRRQGYVSQKRAILVEEGMNPKIIFDMQKQP